MSFKNEKTCLIRMFRLTLLTMMVLIGLCWNLSAVAADSNAAAPATTTAPVTNNDKTGTTPGPQLLPLAVIGETHFDFGVVKKDTTVTHAFFVENKGEGTLVIKQVSPG